MLNTGDYNIAGFYTHGDSQISVKFYDDDDGCTQWESLLWF